MTNVEFQMTKECRITNVEFTQFASHVSAPIGTRPSSFDLRHSLDIRVSAFVIDGHHD